MIDGRTSSEILQLFRTYAQRGGRLSLKAFMVWADLGTRAQGSSKTKLIARLDSLINRNLRESLGFKREVISLNYQRCADIVYDLSQPKPLFKPVRQAPLKVWHDPSQATWTPAEAQRRNGWREERSRDWAKWQQRESAAERRSMKSLKVKQ